MLTETSTKFQKAEKYRAPCNLRMFGESYRFLQIKGSYHYQLLGFRGIHMGYLCY